MKLKQMAVKQTDADEPSTIEPKPTFRVVDDEYRTGQRKPDWWQSALDGATVFVSDRDKPTLRNTALRELARKGEKQLHTKRRVIDGESGTVYWIA